MKNLLYIGNKLSGHGNTPTSIETLGNFLKKEGYNVIFSSSKKQKVLRLLDMGFSIVKYRKSTDFVLIDVYSTSNFWYTFVISQLSRFFKIKYIPILRGGNLPQRLIVNSIVSSWIFKNSAVNIAPSPYLFDVFTKQGYSNLQYIPNSIEIKKYPFALRKKAQPRLLWVRSFAEIYNPLMAIDVFCEIKKQYSEATLCMVGPEKDGSLLATKKRTKELELEVLFPSKLSKSEWITLAKDYDIFINTTHFDNMPVSVMEAMCLGLGIVSTNVGGMPFLLENRINALLIPDGAVNEMVAGILELIESPNLFQGLTTNAHDKAMGFDWEIVKEQWIKVLQ